jgi:hypothetical protein
METAKSDWVSLNSASVITAKVSVQDREIEGVPHSPDYMIIESILPGPVVDERGRAATGTEEGATPLCN